MSEPPTNYKPELWWNFFATTTKLKLSAGDFINWAKNQQNYLCTQPRLRSADNPPSFIRVLAVRMKKPSVLGYLLCAQRRLIKLASCPGWCLCWAHRSFCWICCAVAQFIMTELHEKYIKFIENPSLCFAYTCRWLKIFGSRQANLCLRAFRHDNFKLHMPSHSEGPGIRLSVWRFLLTHCLYERVAEVQARLHVCAGSPELSLLT